MADSSHRFSNSSDDSPFQEDPSDSEHEIVPPDDQDEVIETFDPRNSQLSLVSGPGHSLDDRRHSKRRADFSRQGLTHRDFFKYLVEEGNEAKRLRKAFRTVLEQLDGETRRAQEAERRALELAQRFKIVNDARISSQQELDRVHTELRMYKAQLDNAQREILRGSDLLKDIEAQRDSAEASAARARSTARKLKEEQLMMRAREEGRRAGYLEGVRQGYQQALGGPPQLDALPAELGPLDDMPGEMTSDISRPSDFGRTDPLDGLTMMNLSALPPSTNPALAPSFATALQDGQNTYGHGVQGSRFQEIMATPSTLRSIPLGSASRAGGSSGWPARQDEEARYIRPTLVHNAPPSPQHTDYNVPPDGYIPALGADNLIPLPPPHELLRPPSMSSMAHLSPVSPTDEPRLATLHARDYAYTQQRPRGSPRSFADSLPSTTISQFDLVNDPHSVRGVRDRSSGLSAIPEVSSSMEFSPGTEGRVRSTIIPEPVTFPVADDRGLVDIDIFGKEAPGIPPSHGRELNQRIAGEEIRYSDPEQVEQWRRSTASQSQSSPSRESSYTPRKPVRITTPSPLGGPSIPAAPSPAPSAPSHRRSHSVQSPPSDGRSYVGSGSGNHRRTASSTPISIHIEPPSGPGSNHSPASMDAGDGGMLSPDVSHQPLSPRPLVSTTPTPDRPHSRVYVQDTSYSYGDWKSQPPYYGTPAPTLTPSHTPDLTRGYPTYPHATPVSSSSSGLGRPHIRSTSADLTRSHSELSGRPRTPSGRPQSVSTNERPSSARPVTPGQPNMVYPDSRVPSVLRSPSRASSRQSMQADPTRPASRASAADPRLSLNAGSTPAMFSRPLSGSSQMRRVPSASSINSETSRKSGGFQHYDPTDYVDPAFLASSEDLTSMQSPNTRANTRANAVYSGAGPSKLRSSSPSISYASFRS